MTTNTDTVISSSRGTFIPGHVPHSLESLGPFSSDGKYFLHYTCNSPDIGILKQYRIRAVGRDYGCHNPREVLEIPRRLYQKFGFVISKNPLVLRINIEHLMRLLSR